MTYTSPQCIRAICAAAGAVTLIGFAPTPIQAQTPQIPTVRDTITPGLASTMPDRRFITALRASNAPTRKPGGLASIQRSAESLIKIVVEGSPEDWAESGVNGNNETLTAVLTKTASFIWGRGTPKKFKSVTIRVAPSSNKVPRTLYGGGADIRIRLVPHGTDWQNYVYQFGHELVHAMTGTSLTNSNDSFAWLDEMFGGVGAFYAIDQMNKIGYVPPTDAKVYPLVWSIMADSPSGYVSRVRMPEPPISIADYITQNRREIYQSKSLTDPCEVLSRMIFEKYANTEGFWDVVEALPKSGKRTKADELVKEWLANTQYPNLAKQIATDLRLTSTTGKPTANSPVVDDPAYAGFDGIVRKVKDGGSKLLNEIRGTVVSEYRETTTLKPAFLIDPVISIVRGGRRGAYYSYYAVCKPISSMSGEDLADRLAKRIASLTGHPTPQRKVYLRDSDESDIAAGYTIGKISISVYLKTHSEHTAGTVIFTVDLDD